MRLLADTCQLPACVLPVCGVLKQVQHDVGEELTKKAMSSKTHRLYILNSSINPKSKLRNPKLNQ
jgi:hypothetical protein